MGREKGASTPAVISVIAFLLLVLSSALVLVEGDRVFILREQSSDKALHIAEAGIHDYLWHLNKDSLYYKNSMHPAQGEDEFGNKRWANYEDGQYHLEITPPASDVPLLTVKSEGRVKSLTGAYVTRTVKVVLRKRSFTNYIYLTDHETVEGTTSKIWWITGDIVRGPLHTNDDLHTSGQPYFMQDVTISGHLDAQGGLPLFDKSYKEGADPVEFPATNLRLREYAQADGYYYYGETRITMKDSSLEIVNRDRSGRTTGPVGTVSLPANGIIYVDGIASAKGTSGNGDVYLSGTYSGRLTIAARNIIYLTGDVRYNNADADILGLIADNYIYINHFDKDRYGWYRVDVASYDIEIDAAIFALNHSFGFERYSEGPPKGTIKVVGSIAQRYRGPVGTFSWGGTIRSGYCKDYHYDPRMAYQTPPHFIEPANAGFEITSWQARRK